MKERILSWLRLLDVTTSSGELAEKELLGHICADSFGDTDREISDHQPGTKKFGMIPNTRCPGGACGMSDR